MQKSFWILTHTHIYIYILYYIILYTHSYASLPGGNGFTGWWLRIALWKIWKSIGVIKFPTEWEKKHVPTSQTNNSINKCSNLSEDNYIANIHNVRSTFTILSIIHQVVILKFASGHQQQNTISSLFRLIPHVVDFPRQGTRTHHWLGESMLYIIGIPFSLPSGNGYCLKPKFTLVT